MADEKSAKDDEYGVLLYYKYTQIPDLNDLFTFYDSNCRSLSLLGRVRLAPHGVNVTVGGKLSALQQHIAAAMSKSHLFEGTDFKLATCPKPINDKVAEECGFTTLSIRVVKELVTFSSYPLLKSPEISNAGKHLSAVEFHSVLENPGNFFKTDDSKRVVLLDARNLYETRIGKFHAPNVETLDPEIRQYSDLPSWLDRHSEQLRGNHVLMYCTGGIRCEMASAYVRSKGAGFENVFQLYGGIQRYLEQFPDGGFFKGKNFVFDHRVSVGSSSANVLGSCLVCNFPFDDYSSRSRCTYCRMLVLVCDVCKGKNSFYVCELCQKYGKNGEPVTVSGNGNLQVGSLPASKRLRILCLHGFRQNASGFKGRSASFAKKLKNMAELVYINAPHELQFIYQPNDTSSLSQPPHKGCSRKFAWFIDPDSEGETSAADWEAASSQFDSLQYQQQTAGFDKSLAYLKTVVSQEGPFDGILGFSQGAAMAASVAARKSMDFRFVILCSGFAADLSECEQNSINCPSLHIFGSDHGKDRQIACVASRGLADLFEEGCSVVIEHEYGHIVPTRSPYIDTVKDFLRRFV